MSTATTWQAANAMIGSRAKPGRGTVTHEKVLFVPYCGECWGQERDGCPSGKSPMYRHFSRGGYVYYRCVGHGPQRKACGAPQILVSDLEAAVLQAEADNLMPHRERLFVQGDSISDEIARFAEQGSEAMLAGDLVLAQECMAKIAELRAQPRVAPHWEERYSGMTEADYFASLTRDEQRAYLAKSEIVASRGADGFPSVTIVPRVLASSGSR